MYCSNCGEKVKENARFCHKCGNYLMAMKSGTAPRGTKDFSKFSFKQLMLVISALICPITTLVFPSFVAFDTHNCYYFMLLDDSKWRWGESFYIVIFFLIIMSIVSIINIFCSFGERKNKILVPALINMGLATMLYALFMLSTGDYILIPLGYLFTIVAVSVSLIFSIKIRVEHKRNKK